MVAGRRGAGGSRVGAARGAYTPIASTSACGSRLIAIGSDRTSVTHHPRWLSCRIYARKSGKWWTRPWRCHAPPWSADCPGFWLEQGRFRGQKWPARGRCHAPPSSSNQHQLGSISPQRWTGRHAPAWAARGLADWNRARDIARLAPTRARPPASRAGARARGAGVARRRARDQRSCAAGGAPDARARRAIARAAVAASGTTPARRCPPTSTRRASLPGCRARRDGSSRKRR